MKSILFFLTLVLVSVPTVSVFGMPPGPEEAKSSAPAASSGLKAESGDTFTFFNERGLYSLTFPSDWLVFPYPPEGRATHEVFAHTSYEVMLDVKAFPRRALYDDGRNSTMQDMITAMAYGFQQTHPELRVLQEQPLDAPEGMEAYSIAATISMEGIGPCLLWAICALSAENGFFIDFTTPMDKADLYSSAMDTIISSFSLKTTGDPAPLGASVLVKGNPPLTKDALAAKLKMEELVRTIAAGKRFAFDREKIDQFFDLIPKSYANYSFKEKWELANALPLYEQMEQAWATADASRKQEIRSACVQTVASMDVSAGQSRTGQTGGSEVTEEKIVQDMMVTQGMMNLNHYYTMNEVFTGNMLGIEW